MVNEKQVGLEVHPEATSEEQQRRCAPMVWSNVSVDSLQILVYKINFELGLNLGGVRFGIKRNQVG